MDELLEAYKKCPVTATASILSNKWRPVILNSLLDGSKRFSQIRKAIPEISSKVLSENLAQLESQGVVRRTIVADSRPPQVVYELTAKGRALRGVLDEMAKWGREWGHTLLEEE